jgi:hypothetical protein
VTSSPPPAPPSRPPDTAVRLRITKRGLLVLRTTIGVVVVLIALLLADLGGAFNGSGKGTTSPPVTPAGATQTPTASPKTSTSSAPGSKASTSVSPTTSASPTRTVTSTAVHKITAVDATWKLPNTLSRMVVLAVPGGLEMIGGLLDGDSSSSLVRTISLPSGKATLAGRLAIGVHNAAGAAYHGSLFVYGGGASTAQSTVQRIVLGHVAAKVGTLPAPRSDLVAVQVAGKVVLLGGYDGTNTLADVLVTSDGVQFTVLAKLPVAVRYPAPVVRGGDIYLYGGDVAGKPSDVIQKIDVAAATATLVGHLPEAISHEAALAFGATVWLAGGTDSAGTSAKLYRSDDAVTFTRAGSLPEARSDAGVAMLNGVGYLLGGEDGSRLGSVVVVKPG